MSRQQSLPSTTPEAQSVRSSGIRKFIEAVEKKGLELHSMMLLRHGTKVAEGWWAPYAPHLPHMLFSLSKSFTSSAVGLAVAEGLLSIDDPVVSFFRDKAPDKISNNLAALLVRHLLTMTTGHAEDTTGRLRETNETDWVRSFLSLEIENPPGAPFVYNSGASYMLSAIVQKITDMTLLDYLRPRLFDPLGIENPTWQSCPLGINTGGWGLSIRTEDIARFGRLYLQKGLWNGQRILPEAWVDEATKKQVSNGNDPDSDWAQGYGFQFWRCRHGAYRGDGAFGQYCIVMPEQDAVLAITSGVGDMQAVLNLVWRHILPAMQDAPLRENQKEQARLSEALGCLKYHPPAGRASSALEGQISGVKYLLEPNPARISTLRFDFQEGLCTLTSTGEAGEGRVTCASGDWQMDETLLFNLNGETNPVAAGYTWEAEDVLRLTLRFYTTPFVWTMTCRFTGDQVTVEAKTNVSFGPTEMPAFVGKKAA